MRFLIYYKVEGEDDTRCDEFNIERVRTLDQAEDWCVKALEEFNATIEGDERPRSFVDVKKVPKKRRH